MKKLLIILLLFTSFVSVSQKTISGIDLPKIIKNDTIAIYGEVWVQSSRSEVKQRAKQKTCERKLSRVHKLLKQKAENAEKVDSILVKIEKLEFERDSLKEAFDELTITEAKKTQLALNKCAQQLTDSKYQLWVYKERFKKVKNKQLLLYLVIISEAVLIIVLI